MSNQLPDNRPSTTDQILDLLLDALLERNATRRARPMTSSAGVPPPQPTPPAPTRVPDEGTSQPGPAAAARVPDEGTPPPVPEMRVTEPPSRLASQPEPEPLPPPAPIIHLGKTLTRLAVLVVVLIGVMNIPVNRYGTSLARIVPDSASLIIRDGLVLMGSGPEIYRLEENKLRWISSMDAFEHLGLTWGDVHVVEDSFLAEFEKGRPIHVLLKCDGSSHIYRLENDHKRWIKDIDTFAAEGHVWDDVRFVTCQYLRDLPDGLPIPEDAGTPPQP